MPVPLIYFPMSRGRSLGGRFPVHLKQKSDRVNIARRTVVTTTIMIMGIGTCFIIAHVDESPGPIILSTFPIMLCCLVLSLGVALMCTSAQFASRDSPNGLRHLTRCERWCHVSSCVTKITFIVMLPIFAYFLRMANFIMLLIHIACFLLWQYQAGRIQRHMESIAQKPTVTSPGEEDGTGAPVPDVEVGVDAPTPASRINGGASRRPPPSSAVAVTDRPAACGRGMRPGTHPGPESPNPGCNGDLDLSVPSNSTSRPSALPPTFRSTGTSAQQDAPTPSSLPPPSYAEVVGEGASATAALPSPLPGELADLPPSYSQTQLAP